MLKRFLGLLAVFLAVIGATVGVNFYVIFATNSRILTDFSEISDVDFILVLGASVDGDQPRPMLEDRLKRGIELYQEGVSEKLLLTGDGGDEYYNEIRVMKKYALENGVPEEDIVLDKEGFSTYESIARAKTEFSAEKIVIVSQTYHLYRALYIAQRYEISAYGASADLQTYANMPYQQVREFLARNKDFWQVKLDNFGYVCYNRGKFRFLMA